MNEKIKNSISVGVLTALVLLTTTPLFLMVSGALKPAGTAEKAIQDITFPPPRPESLVLPLRLDLRKFKTLEFSVKKDSGTESLKVGLRDVLNHETILPIRPFLEEKTTGEWQKVVIPVERFELSRLNPALPEKVAEALFWVKEAETETPLLGEVRLVFKRFTLANFSDILVSGHFGRYFFNSCLITTVVVLGNLLFASMVGYAFARKNFPGKELLFFLLLGSIMIPPQALMVPTFILMKHLRWLNTYWALILPNLVIPFNVFFMRQYISALPVSLEDAARMDGANDFQILFRIILPLSRPALAVVGINAFIGSWNAFLYPFLLTNTPEMRTLPVGLALYKDLQGIDWVHLLAASTLTAVPVLLVFLFFQRFILAGLTAGPLRKQRG